jgi:hypothetical protein
VFISPLEHHKSTNRKTVDRHVGKRENIWFPPDEHAAMLEGMALSKENNKSLFIRSAVRKYLQEIKENKT